MIRHEGLPTESRAAVVTDSTGGGSSESINQHGCLLAVEALQYTTVLGVEAHETIKDTGGGHGEPDSRVVRLPAEYLVMLPRLGPSPSTGQSAFSLFELQQRQSRYRARLNAKERTMGTMAVPCPLQRPHNSTQEVEIGPCGNGNSRGLGPAKCPALPQTPSAWCPGSYRI